MTCYSRVVSKGKVVFFDANSVRKAPECNILPHFQRIHERHFIAVYTGVNAIIETVSLSGG